MVLWGLTIHSRWHLLRYLDNTWLADAEALFNSYSAAAHGGNLIYLVAIFSLVVAVVELVGFFFEVHFVLVGSGLHS